MPDPLKQFADATTQALQKLSYRLKRIETREQSPSTYSFVSNVYADLPAAGTSTGLEQFCTNCRKVGEGAGSGTGTQVYTDGSGTWKRVRDDSAAAV